MTDADQQQTDVDPLPPQPDSEASTEDSGEVESEEAGSDAPGPQPVLVFGGTGLLGQAVVRALCEAEHPVRVFARNAVRAAALLPEQCEFVTGDLTQPETIDAAMDNASAVYMSLANPMRAQRPAWDPDTQGARAIFSAAERAGVQRVMRLSAMGVPEARNDWWVADSKAETDEALMNSGLDWTIFRPTWFMESIAISTMGPHLFVPPAPRAPLYWIAGDDYAKQVVAALESPKAIGQVYHCQGPQGFSMAGAFRLCSRIWHSRFILTPIPGPVVRLGAKAVPQLNYMAKLIDMTYEHCVKYTRGVNGNQLHEPTITLEQFAMRLLGSPDWPRKRTLS